MRIFVRGLSVVAVCSLIAAGCSKGAPAPPAAAPPPAPSASSGGRIVGTATRPTSGVPVVIVLEPKTPREFPPQTDKPVMDQIGATFGPALLFVRTGQPTEFRNSDDTLHNVHVTHDETREPQFNVAIPTGEIFNYTFKRDGFYHVGCDIHPAMSAEIFAAGSPFVTTADTDGSFAFDEVPPGAYVVTMYAGGTRTQRDVDVKEGATSSIR